MDNKQHALQSLWQACSQCEEALGLVIVDYETELKAVDTKYGQNWHDDLLDICSVTEEALAATKDICSLPTEPSPLDIERERLVRRAEVLNDLVDINTPECMTQKQLLLIRESVCRLERLIGSPGPDD